MSFIRGTISKMKCYFQRKERSQEDIFREIGFCNCFGCSAKLSNEEREKMYHELMMIIEKFNTKTDITSKQERFPK